jgi:hypothetical protein
MTIKHKPGAKHQNADTLSRWALPNTPDNPAWDPEEVSDFPILGIHACDLDEAFYSAVRDSYTSEPNFLKLVDILSNKQVPHELVASLPPWLSKPYHEGRFTLLDGLLYYRHAHSSVCTM